MKVEVFWESEVESCRICDDLESAGELFVVLTEQARVPDGRFILELPAGMLDDDKGDVFGTAVREVEEETGIFPQQDLTALPDPSTRCRMFPSPGGYDGELSLFLYRGHVKNEVIEAPQGQEMGLCGACVCPHLHE